MPSQLRTLATASLLLVTAAVSIGSASATTVKMVGHAFAEKADTLLYSERHQQIFNGSKLVDHLVTYENTDGKTIAEKTASYPHQASVPQFEFNDLRSGARGGARYLSNDELELYSRKTSDDEIKSGTITVRNDTVVDSGFDRYVAANFNKLLAGDAVKIRFGLPGRQADYKFVVTKPERVEFLGRQALRATIRPASMVLNWLVDPIKLTYDIESRRLLMYEGVSNLKDDDGELQTVRIIYYPEENPSLFSPGTPR